MAQKNSANKPQLEEDANSSSSSESGVRGGAAKDGTKARLDELRARREARRASEKGDSQQAKTKHNKPKPRLASASDSDDTADLKASWLKKKPHIPAPQIPKQPESPIQPQSEFDPGDPKTPSPMKPPATTTAPQDPTAHHSLLSYQLLTSTDVSQDLNETRKFIDALMKGQTEDEFPLGALEDATSTNHIDPTPIIPPTSAVNDPPPNLIPNSPVESIAEDIRSNDDSRSFSDFPSASPTPTPKQIQPAAELDWDADPTTYSSVSVSQASVAVQNPATSLVPKMEDDSTSAAADAYSFEFDESEAEGRSDENAAGVPHSVPVVPAKAIDLPQENHFDGSWGSESVGVGMVEEARIVHESPDNEIAGAVSSISNVPSVIVSEAEDGEHSSLPPLPESPQQPAGPTLSDQSCPDPESILKSIDASATASAETDAAYPLPSPDTPSADPFPDEPVNAKFSETAPQISPSIVDAPLEEQHPIPVVQLEPAPPTGISNIDLNTSMMSSSSSSSSPVQDSSFYLSSPDKSFSSPEIPIANPPVDSTASHPAALLVETSPSTPQRPESPEPEHVALPAVSPSTAAAAAATAADTSTDFKGLAYETFSDFLAKNALDDDTGKPKPKPTNTTASSGRPIKKPASSPIRSTAPPPPTAKKESSIVPPPSAPAQSRRASTTAASATSQIPRNPSSVTTKPPAPVATRTQPPVTLSTKKAVLQRANEKFKSLATSAKPAPLARNNSIGNSSPTKKPPPAVTNSSCSSPSRRSVIVPRTPSPKRPISNQQQREPDTPDLMDQLNGILGRSKAVNDPVDPQQLQLSAPTPLPPANIHEPPPLALTNTTTTSSDTLAAASAQHASAEILRLKALLSAAESANAQYREEIVFLEHLREQEARVVQSGLGLGGKKGAGGGDGVGELATKEEVEKVKKEIEEQETLIKGYQHENEKLTTRLKTLTSQHKDQESRSFLRIETLQREIQSLKTTNTTPSTATGSGTLPNSTSTSGFDAAKLAAEVDTLREKLVSQDRDFLDKETAYLGEIQKLSAQLSEARRQVDTFEGCSSAEVEAMKLAWAGERDRFESFIVELETRLERERGYKEMMMEKEQAELEARLVEIGVGRSTGAKVAATNLSKGKSALGSVEARRVKELEKLVVELQQKLARSLKGGKEGMPELLLANRPSIEEATYIRHLKDHIKRLQNEIETKEASWFSKLEVLHAETTDLKDRYEIKLEELQIRIQETQTASAQAIASATSAHSLASTTHLADLEHQLESLLEKYHDKLTESTDLELAHHLSTASDSKLTLAYKSREAKLRTRIVELENLVDSQAATMESMRVDRASAERDAQVRTQMKDALVQSYETKIAALRNEFHERVFGGEEQKLLGEIHRLRMEAEGMRGVNLELKNKLEISEATRKSVHENTISILKQAQEESAKIALAHHERALTMLRDETKSQTAALLDSEVRRLQKALADSDTELVRWQNRVAVLEKEKQGWKNSIQNDGELVGARENIQLLEQSVKELQILNSDLQTQLRNARSQWPPDQKRFSDLETMLGEMETGFRKREAELTELIALTKRDADGQVARVKAQYVPLLDKKDKELLYFRDEVFRLVEDLEVLERTKFR
ncbi:hypothetical protein HDU98_006375 [Podochytrium sp. JEL0797]|nr:hypothetical protein HDU98_006375 [Podochytrium sp. JEL0797]